MHAPSVPPRKRGAVATEPRAGGAPSASASVVRPTVAGRGLGSASPPLAQIRQIANKVEAKPTLALGAKVQPEVTTRSDAQRANLATQRSQQTADAINEPECIYQEARHPAIIPDVEWKVPEAAEGCGVGGQTTYDCPGCFSSTAAVTGEDASGKLNGCAAGGSAVGKGTERAMGEKGVNRDMGVYDIPAATATNRQLSTNSQISVSGISIS